jgi:hypothetical protein
MNTTCFPNGTRFPLAFALLLGLASLSGCQREAGAPAASTDASQAPVTTATAAPLPKACELLDAERVQVVLGQPAGVMGDDPENCVWSSQGHPGSIAMFMVQLSESADAEEAQDTFDAMVSALGGTQGGSTPQGLGDRAWRTQGQLDAVQARAVVVRKGHRLLILNVTGMRADAGLDARLEQAARDAISRL